MKNTEASKNVSETPETDMLLSNQLHDCVPYDDAAEQLADLACKLERQRDKARTELDLWRDGNILHEIHSNELEEAERERDEARTLADAAMWEADRLRSKLEKLVCERDEARLQYSTTLVFCQSLVKARMEEMEGAE